jgi:tetratricopeptide (TPR) repeat protein
MTAEPERFVDEQAEAQHWLGVLKDGKDGPYSPKVTARLALARIFERRGMLDEAIELLVSSIGAGHREPEVYESLGRLYAAQGRPDLSVRARAEAQQVRLRRQREQAAAEAQQLAQVQAASPPVDVQASRRQGVGYMAAGLLMAVGGFIFAATYEGGVHIILYALPVVGVAVFLRGLTAMFPRH